MENMIVYLLNCIVQGFYGKRSLFMMFQNGFENDVTSKQLTLVTVDNISVDKEPEVTTIVLYLMRQILQRRYTIMFSMFYSI